MKKGLSVSMKPLATAISISVFITGCGTLRGLPGHGGGKRFSTEQRLVAASVKATLKKIDVSPLQGKKVALVFDMMSDEGSGQIIGGRASLGLLFSGASMSSPITSASTAFQIFDTKNQSFTSQATTSNTTSSGTAGTVTIVNSSDESNSEGTSGITENTTGVNSSSTQINTGITSNSDTTSKDIQTGTNNSSTTIDIGSSSSSQNTTSSTTIKTDPSENVSTSGSMTTTIKTDPNTSTQSIPSSTTTTTTATSGGNVTTTQSTTPSEITTEVGQSTVTQTTPSVTTNQSIGATNTTQNGTSNTSINNGASTNTQATKGDTSNISESASNTKGNSISETSQTTKGDNNSTTKGSTVTSNTSKSNSTQNSNSDQNTASKSDQTGKTDQTTNGTQQVVMANGQKQQTEGKDRRIEGNIVYRGLGDYQVLSVPKSDASFLMGQVRNYLMLKGVQVTVPQDKGLNAVLYVSVDIFGLDRSRFDTFIYNRETIKAETGIEMMAVDKNTGKVIMTPRKANMAATYNEHYFLWMGPVGTEKSISVGEGLLDSLDDIEISNQ